VHTPPQSCKTRPCSKSIRHIQQTTDYAPKPSILGHINNSGPNQIRSKIVQYFRPAYLGQAAPQTKGRGVFNKAIPCASYTNSIGIHTSLRGWVRDTKPAHNTTHPIGHGGGGVRPNQLVIGGFLLFVSNWNSQGPGPTIPEHQKNLFYARYLDSLHPQMGRFPHFQDPCISRTL